MLPKWKTTLSLLASNNSLTVAVQDRWERAKELQMSTVLVGRSHFILYYLWNGLGWKGSAQTGVQRFLVHSGTEHSPITGVWCNKRHKCAVKSSINLAFSCKNGVLHASCSEKALSLNLPIHIFVSLTAKHHFYGLHWTKLSETGSKPGSSTSISR